MSRIIDARIRLPHEFRPDAKRDDTHLYHSRYDAVLNLSANIEKSFAELKEEMREANVGHGIIHAEYEFGEMADQLNEAVAQIVQSEPELFSGFGTISMERLRPLNAIRQLERVKELGLLGINIQPGFFDLPVNDRRLYPVYAKAHELDLYVAIHTGINYSTIHPMMHEHPMLIDQVACDFPGIKLVLCHASWPWVPEVVALARKHPNILIDFGGLAPKYINSPGSGWEVMNRFMRNLLSDQILFATDWPVFSMKRAVEEWQGLGLSDEVLQKVLGGNAERMILNARA